MEVTAHSANSFDELYAALTRFRGRVGFVYRGQSEASWNLVPRAGRRPYTGLNDQFVFDFWKHEAAELWGALPESDWDRLAIAQHHGLATRFLDWTNNPLAGAYFAVRKPLKADAALFAYRPGPPAGDNPQNPMDVAGILYFSPRRIAARISQQGASFTIHGPPELALEDSTADGAELHKITIEQSFRDQLVLELEHLAIHDGSVFRDLDGLSRYANWKWKNRRSFSRD